MKEEAKEHDNQEIIEPKESGDASTSLMFQKMQAIASFSPSKNLESEISDYVKEIVQKLRHNDPELKVLDLKKKELASLEKKAIFAALALNHTVEEADFSATYFTPEDAKDFARAFSVTDNYTLKLLILNYNELGDEGIERIV
ncbi:MAG TPA: hypothetical protein VHA13_00565, partial [Gammaproteobacteria bacterium]|nr:hypothetical protein [Gammaproteobacteria bacterium]